MNGKEKKQRSSRMIITTETFQAERVNHIQELCKKHKPSLDRKRFIEEVGYATKISRPTLEKVYDGATKLDYDVIEKLAWFFGVDTNEVLESKF
jgi:hypothetical protein